MVKTVLLDLDDTIFDFKACEKEALSAALDAYGIPFHDADLSDYSEINDRMWKKLERGEITRERLKIERFEVFLSRFERRPDATEFCAAYFEKLSHTSALIDGACDVLDSLSETYRLYAVTNGYAYTQTGRIAASGIGRYFLDIFISEKVGSVKPKKEFFDYCAAHIPNFVLRETVLVGDSPTSDIAGGKAYGLYCIRYNPKHLADGEAIPDAEIASLSELPSVLSVL